MQKSESPSFSQFSIVIPAKNEAEGLRQILPGLVELCPHEIIVVNDGSSDDTEALCKEHLITCITSPYSKGNGASIKAGARRASADHIIFMDGDGQHTVADLIKLVKKYQQGFDMVVGARDRDGQANIGRASANSFYNKLASWIVEQKVEDLTSGMRVVCKKKFLEFLHLLPNGFSYPTTITMAFFRAGYNVSYCPINVKERIGSSHINMAKDGIRFLVIIFKIGTLYSPLKLFIPVSFLFFALGFTHYAVTFFSVGRFTNMSALLLSTSIVVFLMGLISEQINALQYSRKE